MTPRTQGLARRIFQNTSSNVFKLLVTFGITFVMTPVYLRALGDYDYGIWEIMGSIVGYLGLLDIGLRPTISRFIARIDPYADSANWRRVYSTGIGLMVASGVLIGCLFLGWSLIAPGLLAEVPEQSQRYAFFLQLMALQVLLTFPRMGLESALEGGQRYVVMNNITIAHTIAGSAVLYQFISAWDPLLMLCAVNLLTGISKTILFLILLAPPGEGAKLPSPRLWDWPLAKQMYSFGFKSFAQGASHLIENRTDVIVIGGMLGPALVPFYSIPQALLSRIRGLIWTLSHALMPAFSELDAAGRHDRARVVFLEGSRLVVGVLSWLCVGAASLGVPFIALWIGGRYADNGADILYILTAYLFVGHLMPLGSRYLTALDRHGILAKVSITRAILNLGFSIAFALWLGAPGVALGSLVATCLTVWVDWYAALRPMGVRLRHYFANVLLPTVLPSAAFAVLAVNANRMGWTRDWTGFLLTGTACSLVFIFLFAAFGLSTDARARLLRLVRPGAARE